jgi:hypothetical protein
MVTASAVERPRSTLHIRASWSTRDDRVPSAVWLGILWVGMIAGFGIDMHGFVRQIPPPPKVLWVHAFVFTVWMFLLTAQVLLVLRDRVSWHRKFGWFAVSWAFLMAVLGPWAAVAAQVSAVHGPTSYPPFLSVNLVDIVGFLALLAWAITLRKNPAAHKRMMILATISLADPGFARVSGHILPEPASMIPWFFYVFYGNVLLIVLMAAWDWWRGRLMRSFVIGASALLAIELAAALLFFWGPWKTATTAFVQFWAKM